MYIGVSIGITLRSRDGSDAHTLMNNADLALYRAKAEGRGVFRLYEHHMDEIVKERRSLEINLKSALNNGELSLAYQPLISAKDTKTVSFETLARWNHPHRRPIPPSDFIPIAESLGIIAEIGDWVLHRACIEAVKWPEHLSVAVNLSPQQFKSNHITNTVIDALSKSGLAPSRLELEITEGLFMENTEEVLYSLRELKGMGVSISLDDFGTGFSSLSYLHTLPFDKVKIDKSFVENGIASERSLVLLQGVVDLIKRLGLRVVLEGIETQQQLDVMERSIEVHEYQGYLFFKPMSAEDFYNLAYKTTAASRNNITTLAYRR